MSPISRTLYAQLKQIRSTFKQPAYIRQLNQLEAQYLHAEQPKNPEPSCPKILIGPSFSIYEPCFIHDRLLSLALRLRGAEVIPLYCDQMQVQECGVYGGNWMGPSFKKACASCVHASWQLWPKKYFRPAQLSHYLSELEKKRIVNLLKNVKSDTWYRLQYEGLPLGQYAQNILNNNYLVGDHTLITNHEQLGKTHLKNLLYLYHAYHRLLEHEQPYCVIANDSYYGMWALLEKLCQKKNIHFYSHWYSGRKNSWCYAYQDAALNLDFRAPWPAFSKQPLTTTIREKVDNWLKIQSTGEEMVLNTAIVTPQDPEAHALEKLLKNTKPKALLCANAIWDCAALNKQIVFDGMMDWIAWTVQWFSQHPEYELIIKPHPVEDMPGIPKTVETVKQGLEKRNVSLAENTYLLDPKLPFSVYALFPHIQLGIVYTTTVGIEMAAKGLPVITTAQSPYRGFGFTWDPTDQTEYKKMLHELLQTPHSIASTSKLELAYKFIYFYQLHYFSKIGIIDDTGTEPKILIQHINDLLPKKLPAFDYFIDTILAGMPILSNERWMPAT